MSHSIELVPSAHRLVGSLRDIGYGFSTAVADLVDNSVEADATEVRIGFHFDGEHSSVIIADNGKGMSAEQLDEAMRYGSKRSYGERDLGKFGLGLKTASLSQCRKLTVMSRQAGQNILPAVRWDLGHVESTDRWEAIGLEPDEIDSNVSALLRKSSGTVVVWEALDRVLRYKSPSGKSAKDAFIALCREAEEHLSMVFHRFLSNSSRRRLPLSIYLNGNLVEPWDPFARDERATKVLANQRIRFQHGEMAVGVLVQPYILPNEMSFSSATARNAAAGPKKWNRQQGFYIYRNDRLIQSGGWNRLRAADEHTKLARIALDFGPEADDAFQVNIAKMQVQLPTEIRNDLSAIAQSVTAQANAEYRRKPMSSSYRGSGTSHTNPDSHFTQGSSFQSSSGALGGVLASTTKDTWSSKAAPFNVQVRESQMVPQSVEQESHLISSTSLAGVVTTVLYRELSSEPEMLDRVLQALSEAHPEFRSIRRIGEASNI